MAMTSPWLSVSEAAARISGLSEYDVRQMAIAGCLRSRRELDHWELCADAVDELAEHLAEHADRPSVRGGPDIGPEAEHEYARERET